ncbi:MAG: hypothetical protein KDA68_20195, partial [Planctomycetaceae bacterium]|nr:hypothetical protein [Planctomycetaceae bacterium]
KRERIELRNRNALFTSIIEGDYRLMELSVSNLIHHHFISVRWRSQHANFRKKLKETFTEGSDPGCG